MSLYVRHVENLIKVICKLTMNRVLRKPWNIFLSDNTYLPRDATQNIIIILLSLLLRIVVTLFFTFYKGIKLVNSANCFFFKCNIKIILKTSID